MPRHRFSVVVGNIGTVYEGNFENVALVAYNDYVKLSRSAHGCAAGEAVVMYDDGEVAAEHCGYRWFFENHDDLEARTLLALWREESPGLCPICHGKCIPGRDWTGPAGLVTYNDDKDFRVHVSIRCTQCGFQWKDIMKTMGVTLNE